MHEQSPTTRRELRGRTGLPTGVIATVSPPSAQDGRDATPAAPEPAVTAAEPGPAAEPAPAAEPEPTPGPPPAAEPAPPAEPAIPAAPAPAPAAASSGGYPALQWVDPVAAGAQRAEPTLQLEGGWKVARPEDLLARRPRRRGLRPTAVIPTVFLLLVIGVYAAVTLLWPLTNVAPMAQSVAVETNAAPEASPAWPAEGSAALSVSGIPGVPASSGEAASIASITKVVTALLVLDRQPLAPGEQGRDYAFTAADSAAYWQYRARGESSLDVPVDGTLTQLQMLEGMLIGSANNYADRLASDIWPTDADFADAASAYLSEQNIEGITIVDPTGIEAENRASPGALVPLAEKALANPVIAGIVSTQQIELPGAGLVRNGNPLLADPGVVGVKTGTLDAWNLLSAKDIVVGDTTVRAFAAVLGQPGPDSRNAASRALFDRVEQELQPQTSVPAGTVVGRVSTLWGEEADVVSTADASLVLWNGAAGDASTDVDLGEARLSGETVGTLTVVGPLDRDTVAVELAGDIEPPTPWWRLTHPLDLLGING
ncbi:D-alanyl-D-alanine carboxypeptidase [Microbacterium enclense]|uniref:D-alanyl-D-alanine carboxypeptidase n=1 Tax=Microbacterium enclense TaxID=993073 RepID=UPI0036DA7FD8